MTSAELAAARQQFARLQSYLTQDPANQPLRLDLFSRALSLGELEVAQSLLEHGLTTQPDSPVWRHNLAMLHLARHDYAGAEATLRRLIDSGQPELAIRYNLACSLLAQERADEALQLARPLLDQPDVPPQTLALCLRALHRLGRLEEGIETLLGHHAVGGDGAIAAEAWGVGSLLAFDEERVDLAGPWAERALAGEPRQLEALVTRASLALARQDAPFALQTLQTALEIHPQDGRTWSAMALTHMLGMDLEAARSDFYKAVRYMPGHIGTWHGLGWCEILLKDLDAARRAFEQAMELDRNFGETHGGLAVVLALQGQNAAAEGHIQRALGLDANSMSARYAQAILSGESLQQESFTRMAERILKNRPGLDGRPLSETVLREKWG